ncbi:glutathione S-transferase family protein [Porticoccus sp.]
MLKLYGFHVSNYFNMVKLALLEKGFEFEEIRTYPSQEPQFLNMSPMGKVPCLEAREGCLTETSVILEFLEDVIPEVPLLPADPFARAKVRELMKVCELYIELPSRRLYNGVFYGGNNSQQTIDEVRPQVERGLKALAKLAHFNPYLAGKDFSYADIVAYHTFGAVERTMQVVYGWNVMDEVPGLRGWRETVASRPIVHQLDSTIADERQSFFSKQSGE